MTELTTIGLSEAGDTKLDELKELGIFAEKMDGYRFAVALGIAQGVVPQEIAKRKPFLNIGSLDPDQLLKQSVESLFEDDLRETTPYRLIERLAEWGVNELYAQAQTKDIDFVALLEQVENKAS
ncbi:hypothetical protein JMF94_03550 [Desulfovibrio sp. UIB00]|uniref:hypothetical protein n=1 Tax=Desulfovibrio sp. UIB00 TaxID=2804314 RepID=UPI001F0D5AD0|nr:hypothetical protein [Desulfovibrio sp. UIB00]MCH5144154.1 hypothetical protein [Desulfovibrio sp. UIB00]